MSVILYGDPQKDNKLGVIYATGSIPIEDVIAKDVPEGAEYGIFESADLDYQLFDAYRFADGGPDFNPAKGKEIWRDLWRQARAPLLAELDIDFMRALEDGDTEAQAEIVAKKQALRDVTETELPDTLEGIKSVWPEILGVR